MKRQPFTCYGQGHLVAELELDETQVLGIGGAAYPRLLIPATLHFNPFGGSIPDSPPYGFAERTPRL